MPVPSSLSWGPPPQHPAIRLLVAAGKQGPAGSRDSQLPGQLQETGLPHTCCLHTWKEVLAALWGQLSDSMGSTVSLKELGSVEQEAAAADPREGRG